MSRVIDEKVVSMQFDNRNFESNVKTTLSSLENLNKSLKFDNAGKGLENVNTAISRCNFSPLNSAIDTVGVKFNALYTIADQVLRNITNSAYNAGKNIASALTIEPVKTGLLEYETQINAVQTILANTESKGTTLTDVNAALDELNTYADKTIYNFTEMTNNIGKFTAAGVDLETSVSAIQGIANLAAVSGSTSQQASVAMYQLSQALSAGRVSLMDWNSVVNAGMGGELFQNALIRTSELLKTGAKDAIDTYGTFRESLTRGEWLTTEVLTETLKQLSGAYTEAELVAQGFTEEQAAEISKLAETATNAATKVKTATQLWDTLKEAAQSGWTQTWEILIGDFEEARSMWTKVSDTIGEIIGDSAQRRNDLLSGALDTNWEKFIKGVNEAGIETEAFEEKVRSLAEARDIDIYALIEKYGSFEEVFRSGAASSDLLRDALSTMNGTLKETQEYTVQSGDSLWLIAQKYGMTVDELAKLNNIEDPSLIFTGQILKINEALNGTSDSIEGVSDETLGLIDKLGELGGRELLIESLANIFNGLKSAVTPIGDAFREIFPALKPEQLFAVIEKFHALTENFKLNEEQTEQVKTTFMGLFSVIRTGGEFIFAIISGIGKLIGNFRGLGSGILSATSSFGDYLLGLRETVEETDIFTAAVDKVVNFIQKIIDGIKGFASALKAEFAMPGFEGFLGLLGGIWNVIKKVGSTILKVGTILGDALANVFTNSDLAAGLDVINGGLLATILLGVKKFINSLTESLDVKGGFIESIKALRDSVLDTFSAFQEQLKAETLKKIAVAIAILAASILVLSMIDPAKMTAALAAIGGLFIDLMVAMKTMTALGDAPKGLFKTAHLMVSMSAAILILAAAMKVISSMTWEEMARGLTGVLGLTAIMVAAGRLMSSNSKQVIEGATQMVIAATAMLIFASVCKKMGELSWEQLAKGVVGIGLILAEFVGLNKLMKKIEPENMIRTSLALGIIAVAMEIFADVCGKFGGLKWEELGKAVVGMGVILAEFVGLQKLMSKFEPSNMIRSALSLGIIAVAMEIFADVCGKFGGLKWEELGKAGAAMAGILALAAGFTLLSGLSTQMAASVTSLVVIAVAMEIFADICQKFSAMKWEELAKAGAAIGGILALAAGFALLAGLAPGMLASSAALLIMATSLAILVPVLSSLGSMTWGEIAKGLITMALAFGIIGVAGIALGVIAPLLILASVGVAALGAACLTVGAGIWLFATGLSALAVAGTAGATAIVAALSIIITGVVSLIPVIFQRLGDAVVVFAMAIAEMAPALGEALKALVLTLIDVLVECIPALAEGALKLLVGVMAALVEYGPQLIDLLFDFVIGLLDGFAERIPDLIQSAVGVIMSFLSGVVDALKSIDITTLTQGLMGVGLITAFMAALAGIALLAPAAMVGVLAIGAVIAELAFVLAAIGALAQIPGLEWLVNESGDFLMAIGNAIGGFVGGIVGGFMEGMTSSLPQIASDLSMFMLNLAPFIAGAKMIDTTMLEGVTALAEMILILTGASIIEGLTSWLTGGSSLTDFANQLIPFGEAMAGFSATIDGKINEAAIIAAANAGKIIAEMAATLPNSGGVVGWFTGENDMGAFFDQLIPFGEAMVDFSSTVDGKINESAVLSAANAGKMIAEMATTLPNSGGVVGWFSGENDMTTFASQLIPFGEAISEFSMTVDGKINESAVVSAANAGKMLAEMATTLPNSGGVVGWFTGDNEMSDFGEQLVSFGEAMVDFSETVDGNVNETAVTAAATAGKMIAEMANIIPNTGGIVSWFTGDNDMDNFGEQLVSFGEAMSDFSDSISATAATNISAAVVQVKHLFSLVRGMSGIDFGVITSFEESLGKIGKTGVSGFVKAFENSTSKVDAAGKGMINQLITAIKGSSAQLATAAKNIAIGAAASLRNAFTSFHSAGAHLAQGFANGISENSYKAAAKAKAMAEDAVEAARRALDINSPSKVFMRLGSAIPEGFAKGIGKFGSDIENSSIMMTSAAINGTRSAIARIAEAINTDIDSQPTIRPVLDLSDVKSGASSINGLFGMQPSVDLLTNVGSINSMMNRRQNELNTTNDDVVAAIKDLKTAISESSGDSYSINGITYDDGSNIAETIKSLIRASRLEGRI